MVSFPAANSPSWGSSICWVTSLNPAAKTFLNVPSWGYPTRRVLLENHTKDNSYIWKSGYFIFSLEEDENAFWCIIVARKPLPHHLELPYDSCKSLSSYLFSSSMLDLEFCPFFSRFEEVWVLESHKVGNFMAYWNPFVTPCPKSRKLVSYVFHAWYFILFFLHLTQLVFKTCIGHACLQSNDCYGALRWRKPSGNLECLTWRIKSLKH